MKFITNASQICLNLALCSPQLFSSLLSSQSLSPSHRHLLLTHLELSHLNSSLAQVGEEQVSSWPLAQSGEPSQRQLAGIHSPLPQLNCSIVQDLFSENCLKFKINILQVHRNLLVMVLKKIPSYCLGNVRQISVSSDPSRQSVSLSHVHLIGTQWPDLQVNSSSGHVREAKMEAIFLKFQKFVNLPSLKCDLFFFFPAKTIFLISI